MTAKIDLLTLQLFVAIVEEQSIAKAAEKKNIAASAVSRRISDIEVLFKVELLHRHSKGIEPTPAGFALLEHARIILGNLSKLEAELTGFREGKRGLIRVCANKSAILEALADELSLFLEQHPLVHIDIEEDLSPAIVRAVMENRADIGIFGGNIDGQDLELLSYRSDSLVALVTRDHPLADRSSVRFRELVTISTSSAWRRAARSRRCVSGPLRRLGSTSRCASASAVSMHCSASSMPGWGSASCRSRSFAAATASTASSPSRSMSPGRDASWSWACAITSRCRQ
ncbi:DNA-binding transcriptional LysR family regulator [Bradyrhizobium sp. LM4.3]